jgi:hypothetical protein
MNKSKRVTKEIEIEKQTFRIKKTTEHFMNNLAFQIPNMQHFIDLEYRIKTDAFGGLEGLKSTLMLEKDRRKLTSMLKMVRNHWTLGYIHSRVCLFASGMFLAAMLSYIHFYATMAMLFMLFLLFVNRKKLNFKVYKSYLRYLDSVEEKMNYEEDFRMDLLRVFLVQKEQVKSMGDMMVVIKVFRLTYAVGNSVQELQKENVSLKVVDEELNTSRRLITKESEAKDDQGQKKFLVAFQQFLNESGIDRDDRNVVKRASKQKKSIIVMPGEEKTRLKKLNLKKLFVKSRFDRKKYVRFKKRPLINKFYKHQTEYSSMKVRCQHSPQRKADLKRIEKTRRLKRRVRISQQNLESLREKKRKKQLKSRNSLGSKKSPRSISRKSSIENKFTSVKESQSKKSKFYQKRNSSKTENLIVGESKLSNVSFFKEEDESYTNHHVFRKWDSLKPGESPRSKSASKVVGNLEKSSVQKRRRFSNLSDDDENSMKKVLVYDAANVKAFEIVNSEDLRGEKMKEEEKRMAKSVEHEKKETKILKKKKSIFNKIDIENSVKKTRENESKGDKKEIKQSQNRPKSYDQKPTEKPSKDYELSPKPTSNKQPSKEPELKINKSAQSSVQSLSFNSSMNISEALKSHDREKKEQLMESAVMYSRKQQDTELSLAEVESIFMSSIHDNLKLSRRIKVSSIHSDLAIESRFANESRLRFEEEFKPTDAPRESRVQLRKEDEQSEYFEDCDSMVAYDGDSDGDRRKAFYQD